MFVTTLLSLVIALIATAASANSDTCDAIASHVARETGVPTDVLRAITRIETGRARQGRLQPWPWTVNMEGRGKWFETREAAEAYVARHFARGARSFDVGCFQINYRWHGKAFSSVNEMFTPLANGRYAARFLTELYREFGDWTAAAGAYHSRTPKFANAYAARFAKARRSLGPSEPAVPVRVALTEPVREKVNRYPLLRNEGETPGAGSLVRLSATNTQPLFANRVSALVSLR